ncbi:hypothetical protein BKP35_06385 [Anaerobacillus arseniciselenatis]|uniref:Uncharacterized protein n=1 Tax=Anaerobacillus arseniciselenatis TaxID=85682 RepID=A0A1S2LPR2_9BACI|nr:hypothetical protein [Anaerobacillus arseniciselenatis]OIJ14502.1 hypothetical protein BKP35_06385 [Anaerobacillus arseniciselenatis]
MLTKHVLITMFIYIPEALLTLCIPLALLGVKVEWKKILPMGIVFGTVMYTVGVFTGNYIIVILVLYSLVVGGLKLIKAADFYEISICTAITFSIVLMLEYICLKILSLNMVIDPITLENTPLRISIFAVQILLALCIYHIIRNFKLSIFDE